MQNMEKLDRHWRGHIGWSIDWKPKKMAVAILAAINIPWDQERGEALQKALAACSMQTARDVIEAAIAARGVDGSVEMDISGNQVIFTGTEHVIGFSLSVVRDGEIELFIL